MLSFFPTPYPDELLYSVLARYHLMSGNMYPALTNKQLFGYATRRVGFLYASEFMRELVSRLPPDVFNAQKLIEEHTLTPYVLRFFPTQRKQNIYDYLFSKDEDGNYRQESRSFLTMRQFELKQNKRMRYCPICAEEERAKYGEAYWHRTHQIQLLPICDIHGCALVDSDIALTPENNRKYITAEETITDVKAPFFPRDLYMRPLANTLVTFLKDPFVFGDQYPDSFWCGVLADELSKNGFGTIREDGTYRLHVPKGHDKVVDIYSALTEYYGEKIVAEFLTRSKSNVIGLMAHPNIIRAPEQYALIATALGADPHRFTIPGYDKMRKKGQYVYTTLTTRAPLYTQGVLIDDDIAKQMREMASRGYLWNKRRVAEILHLDMQKLTYFAKIRGVEPFWVNGSPAHVVNKNREKWHKIKITVTDDMYERIKRRSDELGMYRYIEYARYCMEKELTEAGYPPKA